MISNDKKKKLRSIANEEKALVIIGKSGLTDTLYESFENALIAHNLVKVSLQKTAPLSAKEVAERLAEDFGCEVIQIIGKVVVLYRYSKEGRIKV